MTLFICIGQYQIRHLVVFVFQKITRIEQTCGCGRVTPQQTSLKRRVAVQPPTLPLVIQNLISQPVSKLRLTCHANFLLLFVLVLFCFVCLFSFLLFIIIIVVIIIIINFFFYLFHSAGYLLQEVFLDLEPYFSQIMTPTW